jgi:3-oxoacyl-[acyl-carrier-protein] synthase II
MRRIVVTGYGIVSPLGCGADLVWKRLLAGRSGIRRLSDNLVPDVPAKIAGVVPTIAEDAEGGFDPNRAVSAKDQMRMDRFIQFAMAAAN